MSTSAHLLRLVERGAGEPGCDGAKESARKVKEARKPPVKRTSMVPRPRG